MPINATMMTRRHVATSGRSFAQGGSVGSPNFQPRQVVIDLTNLKSLYCGLGQFSLHLGRALARMATPALDPAFLVPAQCRHLLQEPGVRQIVARGWMKERIMRFGREWIARLWSGPPTALWHSTTQFLKYLPLNDRVPVVLTIHDLNFLREKAPEVHPRHLGRLQAYVDRASAVTTISRFVAEEIKANLDLRGKPLRVIYNGPAADDRALKTRPQFIDDRPFLLTLGDITTKKNFHVLVEFARRLPDYMLIIAGNDRTSYAHDIRELAANSGIAERVFMPGIVNDAVRGWLYGNCTAFLFPSTTEGFGLPVIEAMRFGKPVFLSDATSLPEIGGPLAFYWRSFIPEHMVQVFHDGMAAFMRSAQYGQRLASWARQFSWQKAASQYVELYEDVLESNFAPRLARQAA
jgi:glycosyltransferase involved in cell wall biosynthesis